MSEEMRKKKIHLLFAEASAETVQGKGCYSKGTWEKRLKYVKLHPISGNGSNRLMNTNVTFLVQMLRVITVSFYSYLHGLV